MADVRIGLFGLRRQSPDGCFGRFDVFTGGESLGEVKQHQFEKGAEKWGGLSIASVDKLQVALPWFRESYERIKRAIANNEPTGWYAKVGDAEETPEEEA